MLFLTFLLTAILISLSGVMMPGPVLASAIAEGCHDKYAGMKIAIGHALIEFPIMYAIFFGFGYFFTSFLAKAIIGIAGGILLLFLGWKMIFYGRMKKEKPVLRNPWILGVVVSASSPYFFLWWATVGASLIFKAIEIGLFAFISFTFVHWLCDFGWLSFVSITTFKSKKFWNERVRATVFLICGIIMIFFGIYFFISASLILF